MVIVKPDSKKKTLKVKSKFTFQYGYSKTFGQEIYLKLIEKFTFQYGYSKTSFLSINEKRAELGYSEVDGGDEILMNGIQTPLSEMTTPVTPVAEDVTSVEDV